MELCSGDVDGLGWENYAVIGAMLGVTCGIGVVYACLPTSDDHLTAGGTMPTLPMALSLATGFITAIELLGNPAEMYYNGSQFWMTCLSFIIVIPVTSYFYLPVYMNLRLTSAYEYLELRFNSYTRYLASGLYVLQMILYTSVAVYAPALALSHVTGLNTYLAVTIVYGVCIFYASQGGMKAVIMTDTFQTIILLGSIIAVLSIGDAQIGGPSLVFSTNSQSGRIELLNMDPSPMVRHSFWSVVVGGSFYWATMFCSNQASIQKYLSVRTLSQARSALWISCLGLIVIFTINFYTGMVMYTYYKDCDPLLNGEIKATDELLPFYVIKAQGHLKGIPGLFIAGIFAASLGTVAAAVNSLAAVTVKDLIGGLMKINIPANKEAFICKWLALVFGVISFCLVFVVEQLGSVLQVALSFNGIIGGVTLGLFSLGMFFPWATSKGALTGAVTGLALVAWMGFSGLGGHPEINMPLSTEFCGCNSTDPQSGYPGREVEERGETPSYLWYSAVGCIVTLLVGILVSLTTGVQDPCHPDLISPPVHSLLCSLPKCLKRRMNLPIEEKENSKSQDRPTKELDIKVGVINHGLNIDSEVGLKI